jgi:hypothetical protein
MPPQSVEGLKVMNEKIEDSNKIKLENPPSDTEIAKAERYSIQQQCMSKSNTQKEINVKFYLK